MVHKLWQRLSAKERAVLACVLAECLFITFVWVVPQDLASVGWMLVLSGGPVSVWLWSDLVRYFRAQLDREQQQPDPPLHWAGGPNQPQ